MSWRRHAIPALALLAVIAISARGPAADDEAKKEATAKRATAAKDDEAAKDAAKAKETKDEEPKDDTKKEDPYALPEKADVAELQKFIEKLKGVRPATRDEAIQKWLPALKAAASKIMELKKDDTKSQEYKDAQGLFIQLRMNDLIIGEEPEQKKVIAEIKQFLTDRAKDKSLTLDDARLGQVAAQRLEFSGKTELAKEAIESFHEALSSAAKDDEKLKDVVEALGGTLRRMELVGNKIEISGKTFEGKDFDWAAYSKGKVVLVDFWATWCGPCIAELPNVRKNYDKYHEKGFDVIGISLDEDRADLESFLEKEKIPWTTLFEEGKGWKHPVAKHYGIQGIPTVILVDKDGKVVSLNARGPELGKQLEKLIGPVEDKPADKTEAKDEEKKEEKKPAE